MRALKITFLSGKSDSFAPSITRGAAKSRHGSNFRSRSVLYSLHHAEEIVKKSSISGVDAPEDVHLFSPSCSSLDQLSKSPAPRTVFRAAFGDASFSRAIEPQQKKDHFSDLPRYFSEEKTPRRTPKQNHLKKGRSTSAIAQ